MRLKDYTAPRSTVCACGREATEERLIHGKVEDLCLPCAKRWDDEDDDDWKRLVGVED